MPQNTGIAPETYVSTSCQTAVRHRGIAAGDVEDTAAVTDGAMGDTESDLLSPIQGLADGVASRLCTPPRHHNSSNHHRVKVSRRKLQGPRVVYHRSASADKRVYIKLADGPDQTSSAHAWKEEWKWTCSSSVITCRRGESGSAEKSLAATPPGMGTIVKRARN